MCAIGLVVVACSGAQSGKSGAGACPALRPESSTLDESFGTDERVNAKLRPFLQAAKDVDWASTQVEHLAAGACRRIGQDLGLGDVAMQPMAGPGGVAAGACGPVVQRIDAVLREGVRLWITYAPAQCRPNMDAWNRCGGRCDVQGDVECRASCQAHANVHASCHGAQLSVRVSQGDARAVALIATLQANLPDLMEAQYTLGQRLTAETQSVSRVAGIIRRQLGEASAEARGCAKAAGEMATDATTRMRVSVRASAAITSLVGGR